MARFGSLPALTEHVARAIATQISGAVLGFSSKSCSAYVTLSLDEDGDGFCRDEFKLRISDHPLPSSGAHRTLRVDELAEQAHDDDGDYLGCDIADDDIDYLIAAGVSALKQALLDA